MATTRNQSKRNESIDIISTNTDDLPEHVDPKFLTLLAKINENLEQININTTATNERVEVVETNLSNLTETVGNLSSEMSSLTQTVTLLQAKLMRSERHNAHLKNEISGLKTQSLAENLVFTCDGSNYVEAHNENCVSLVRHFLVNVMGLVDAAKFLISDAYRMGSKRPGSTRSIIARLPIAADRKKVMDNTKRLKGTRHFISRHLPLEVRERQQFAMPVYKEKRKNPSTKAKIVNDKLFVNGELQVQFLPHKLPHIPDSANIPADITEGDLIEDAGSEFQGYAAAASTLMELSVIRDQLLLNPKTIGVSDVMCTYRFGTESGGVVENFDSDWDFGIGLSLLKWMRERNLKNIVCFVTRTCHAGYKHIGDRRFRNSIAVCEKAVQQIVQL